MKFPKQGDLVFMDAEAHSAHEIGGHNPKSGNIRRPFLIISRNSFNQKTGEVDAMAITHKHRARFFRKRIVDSKTKINGDLLLDEVPEYDFQSRHGAIIGHLQDSNLFDQVRHIFLQSF